MYEWSRVPIYWSEFGVSIFYFSHSGRWIRKSHCSFNCISLMANDVDHLFTCLFFFSLPSKHPLRWNAPSWLSVQFSRSVVSDSLRPHELQHARPPCPSPTPGVYPDSHPSSQWCHPAISSSVVPFSSFPQSLPASESFPMSQLFAWGGQITGVSALASFLPFLPSWLYLFLISLYHFFFDRSWWVLSLFVFWILALCQMCGLQIFSPTLQPIFSSS